MTALSMIWAIHVVEDNLLFGDCRPRPRSTMSPSSFIHRVHRDVIQHEYAMNRFAWAATRNFVSGLDMGMVNISDGS